MSLVDLHLHSTASDGRLSPEALVGKAAELGLEVIALTDHDTVDGINAALKAAADFPQLTLIPGVEISTDLPGGEAHVLGYFIDYTNRELEAALERFRNSRQGRARGMVSRLADFGMKIDWQRVRELAGDGSIGRPHIARAMLEKGYIETFEEAFDKYIGHGKPAYVEREKMTPEEAVQLIVRSQGLPVLAHPYTVTEPEAMVVSLKNVGLIGIEAYYKDYSPNEIETLLNMAEKYGLIATGGTDYHGIGDSSEVILGGVEVPMKAVEQIIARADEKTLKLANL